MSNDTSTPVLSANMPADAAFRRLARLCEERAAAADTSPDRQLLWRYGQQTAVQLAQWTRRLPPSLEGRVTAAHLCAGLTVLCGEREGDTQDRQVHRVAMTLYLTLLREAEVRPADDLYVAATLWAFLQRMALLAAVSVAEPAGREAASRAQRMRSAIMRVRENLVTDMAEMVLAGAALVLARTPQEASADEAMAAAEAAPGGEAAAGEEPQPV